MAVNPTVSLTNDYATQIANAARQQKLAEMLQQQALAPIETQSYKGVQAAIPWTAVLAKALQGFGGQYLSQKATGAENAAKQQARTEALSELMKPETVTSGDYNTVAPNAPPVTAQELQSFLHPAPAAAPAVPVPAAPMAMTPPRPTGPVPFSSDLAGAPPPNPLVRALSNTPDVAPPSPIAPPSPVAPPPVAAAPKPIVPTGDVPRTTRPMTGQELLQRGYQMAVSGNPLVAAAAPEVIKQAQEQIKKISDLAATQAQKDAAHAEDVTHATAYVKALPNISDDDRASLLAAAEANGVAGVKSFMDKSQEFFATPQARSATPDEISSFGLPKGSTGQYDKNGVFKVTYNPTGDINENARTRIAAHNSAREDMIAAQNAAGPGDLNENAKDTAALAYIKTGALPSGMGKPAAAMRKDIMNRAGEITAKKGIAPEQVVADRAQFRADSQSLTGLTKTTDMITAFENTAAAHFDNALKLAPKGVPTNMGPWVNNWVQTGETGTGNAAIPAYVAQLLTGANEYAKVIEGATGAAGSSVSSRQQAAALFNKAYNYDQIKDVIDIAKKSMETKKNEYNAQKGEIQKRLNNSGQVAGAAGGAAPAAVTQTKVINGVTYHQVNGQWVQ